MPATSARASRAIPFFAAAFLFASAFDCGRGAPLPGTPSEPSPAGRASAPRVLLPSGAAIAVEIARTDAERAQGLMYRASMPRDAGMVFLFDGLEIRPFWMKNCHFPLDMVYARSDGTIVDVLKNVPPCAADPCPSYPPKEKADTVLELNAGIADTGGAVPGAKLKFMEIPGR